MKRLASVSVAMRRDRAGLVWLLADHIPSMLAYWDSDLSNGLSLSKTLVELMGGSIRAESRPNEGTSFIVTLKR